MKPAVAASSERRIVRPNELDLDSPGRRDYWVALSHDNLWADHLIPLTVFVGKQVQSGKGVVAFGSNHGDEYEGPCALKRLLREIEPADVTGRLIVVPVLNVSAFRSGTRSSVDDDGVNLNRAFIDGAGTTPEFNGITHRIARFVRDSIWPRIHVSIDLHAGGEVAQFARCASYHEVADPAQARAIEETARWFGTPVLMTYQNSTPGLLPSDAENCGKISVGTELGWGRSVSPEGVAYAMHGVRAAAIHHGQMRGSVSPIGHHKSGTQKIVRTVDPACAVIAPRSGHYESLIACGAEVSAGTAIGLLHDFDRIDEEPLPLIAGVSGTIVAQAWGAQVRRGQHVAIVGTHAG